MSNPRFSVTSVPQFFKRDGIHFEPLRTKELRQIAGRTSLTTSRAAGTNPLGEELYRNWNDSWRTLTHFLPMIPHSSLRPRFCGRFVGGVGLGLALFNV